MNIILCFLIGFSAASIAVAQQSTALEDLVKRERTFAEAAREKTVKKAFLEFLADDAVVFEPGPVNARKFWSDRPESAMLLSWEPVWADISSDGRIGYTTGGWEFRPNGKDDDPVAFGQYITVWEKRSDGDLKAVLDIGISHKKPEKSASGWESPERLKIKKPGRLKVFRPKNGLLKESDYRKLLAADARI
ncbi:MAG: nuclear transport factor 2 family protein, partial [Acidobacteria bacterium]|nr:nuclear transport factor 2 family protein [Acidobacteriota bacterium]